MRGSREQLRRLRKSGSAPSTALEHVSKKYEYDHHRPKTLELLQRPARRRDELWRLRRAIDISAVPQDGRRAYAGAVQPEEPDSGGVRLAELAPARRRRAVRSLPPHAGEARGGEGVARADFRQGAE